MNGYELSRVWFAYTYNHPDKFSPIDTALYFWIIEVFNRARWSEKIYLPSGQAMQHIGCKSYKAYINSFNKLEAEGFIKVVERSKNQYTANIIALVSNAKALTEASTKATTNASTEASTEALTNASTVYKNKEHTTENKELDKSKKNTLAMPDDIEPDVWARYLKLNEWLKENAPNILKMQQQITVYEYQKLTAKMHGTELAALLIKMHNWKGIDKKNVSVYLTALDWAKRENNTVSQKAKKESETITHFGIAANRLG
jgi:phage terminase small subunit